MHLNLPYICFPEYFVDILKTDSRPNKKIQIDIEALVKL